MTSGRSRSGSDGTSRPARTRRARRGWGPADDPGAVADERGFVHGVRNLRIADASLMPVVPRANTNVPTIMVGEKIGEWVREEVAG